eukprot:jgi/Ulvmu1/2938/UM149_0017.1
MLCAAARMQACLNLIDPATFPLYTMPAPPLSDVLQLATQYSTNSDMLTPSGHPASGDAGDYTSLAHSLSADLPSCPPSGPVTDVQQGASAHTPSQATDAQGAGSSIHAAEVACTAAEEAETAAGDAKTALDQARAGLLAINTAVAACAGSGIDDQLGHARASAAAAVQARQEEHMAALAKMRATAEVAEAACAAAERQHGMVSAGQPETYTPNGATGGLSSTGRPTVPCVLLGLLSQVVWDNVKVTQEPMPTRAAARVARSTGASIDDLLVTTRTHHGTVVRGPCILAKVSQAECSGQGLEKGSYHLPVADVQSCTVDAKCTQVIRLLKHRSMCDCLSAFRLAFAATRRLTLASFPPPPGAAACAGSMPLPTVLSPNRAALNAQSAATMQTGGLNAADSQVWERIAPPQTMHEAVMRYGPPPPATWHGPTLLFLGTGSSEPSKYRGPSAILLQVRIPDTA